MHLLAPSPATTVATPQRAPGLRYVLAVLAAAACSASTTPAAGAAPHLNLNQLERVEIADGYGNRSEVTITRITYRAFDGRLRDAYVILPRGYRAGHDPPIPLVISPHGRGVKPQANAVLWGNLPAVGDFAVVCPGGQGKHLTLYAWGYRGDIADLARMPAIVEHALPFVRVDPRRIYAIGSSMGGQEALLLLAREPHLLAGVAAFDSDTNLAARYTAFASIPHGLGIRAKLVAEVGGTPLSVPGAYAARSPIDYAHQIAFSGVPLQIWWSTKDRIVRDQGRESGLLYRRIVALNPAAPVVQVVGTWAHSAEFKPTRRIALALSAFGLMPVQPNAAMTPAQKRSLGLPADWHGDRLALTRQRSSTCRSGTGVACGGSS